MKRGDIYLVSLDATQENEQKAERPVLIVSPEPFNRLTRLPVVLPITSSRNFARTAGFAVLLIGTGLKTIGVIRCDQPRILDLDALGTQKLETVPVAIMDEVLWPACPAL